VSRLGRNGSDGTAHGSGGSITSVGVGTGGMVRLGGGDDVADGLGDTDGAVVAVCAVRFGAVAAGVGAGAGVAGGVAAWVRVGRGEAECTGAAPMLPAPIGRSAAAGWAMGVASSHPIATAMGKPSVTSPIKSGLGDNRTL
jgi:hypothetical protein